jgi:hypothetical protein
VDTPNPAAAVTSIKACSDPQSEYVGAIINSSSNTIVYAAVWNGETWLRT